MGAQDARKGKTTCIRYKELESKKQAWKAGGACGVSPGRVTFLPARQEVSGGKGNLRTHKIDATIEYLGEL